jgi:sarcosine oxidase subunit gamma
VDNLILNPKSPLEPYLIPGRYGVKSVTAGVRLKEKHNFSLVSLTVFKEHYVALSNSILKEFGIKLLKNQEISRSKEICFMNIAPGQWLAYSEYFSAFDLISKLGHSVGKSASIVDLSDARAIIELSGPKVQDTLAKGISIDLREGQFLANHVFSTFAAQFSITLWQSDDEFTANIAVFRAFGESLLNWLITSASEFGCDVEPVDFH